MKIFWQVIRKYICKNKVIEIDFYKNVLPDEKNMKKF